MGIMRMVGWDEGIEPKWREIIDSLMEKPYVDLGRYDYFYVEPRKGEELVLWTSPDSWIQQSLNSSYP